MTGPIIVLAWVTAGPSAALVPVNLYNNLATALAVARTLARYGYGVVVTR